MKKRKRVHHHIRNQCNGGKSTPENLLYIDEVKEKKIHEVFGNRDWVDMIIFMLRIARAKHYEEVNPKIKELYKFLK